MATNMTGPLLVSGVPVGTGADSLMGRGRVFWVDPYYGADGNGGYGPDYESSDASARPLKTVLAAYNKCVDGRGDVVKLLSYANTSTNTTDYLSAAFTWSKNNTHLIGVSAGNGISSRARISYVSTALTAALTLFTISGSNCRFENINWFLGNSGDYDQIAVAVTGERNCFVNCHFGGIGHDTPAARANSRSLTIAGGSGTYKGEHLFERCVFGLNTIARTAANAEVEFLSFTSRNVFRGCYFIGLAAGSGTAHLCLKAGASTVQDMVIFDGCLFHCCVKQSGAATQANVASVDANAGGELIMKDSYAVGISDWNAADNGNVFIMNTVAAAGTGGLAVAATR